LSRFEFGCLELDASFDETFDRDAGDEFIK